MTKSKYSIKYAGQIDGTFITKDDKELRLEDILNELQELEHKQNKSKILSNSSMWKTKVASMHEALGQCFGNNIADAQTCMTLILDELNELMFDHRNCVSTSDEYGDLLYTVFLMGSILNEDIDYCINGTLEKLEERLKYVLADSKKGCSESLKDIKRIQKDRISK